MSSQKRQDQIHGYTASLLQNGGQISLLLNSMTEHALANPGNPRPPTVILHEIIDGVLGEHLERFSKAELGIASTVLMAAVDAIGEDVFIVHAEPDGEISLIQPKVPLAPPEYN